MHRYHAVALPLHQADEELSIAPRLERAVPQALLVMKREHVELDAVLAGLLPLWERLAAEPGLRCQLASGMARDVARMRQLWARHLAAEEETIFRALRRLSAADSEQITREMRARRSAPQ